MEIITSNAKDMEYKIDSNLGFKIGEILQKKGVETPLKNNFNPNFNNISNNFKNIMIELGLDLNDDSLKGTPDRVAKMFTKEIFYGLDYNKFPKCTAVENKMNYDEMIIVSHIKVNSVCEHHFVTIDGEAKIAYIPQKKVLGLSKINRIVDFFSRRPQIQERLTEQIFFALCFILDTQNVAVEIKATHFCVKTRGAMDINSKTKTTKIGGVFKKIEVKNEFLKS